MFWLASAEVFTSLPQLPIKLPVLILWWGCSRRCVTPLHPPFGMQALLPRQPSICKKYFYIEASCCQFVQWVQEAIICHRAIHSEVSLKYVSLIYYTIYFRKSIWIFSQNIVVASLYLFGFIYLFTSLSPCSMSLGDIYEQSQGTHFPGGYR